MVPILDVPARLLFCWCQGAGLYIALIAGERSERSLYVFGGCATLLR